MLKRSDRIIIRLERAGGSLTEASELLRETDKVAAPLANAVANANIMIGDIRAAVIAIQRGDSMESVGQYLEDSWRNLWPISAEISPDERMSSRIRYEAESENSRVRGRGGRAPGRPR